MGLNVALEDERGQQLEIIIDDLNQILRLLRPYQGGDSLLAQIDPYGNTVFNRIQMPFLLSAFGELAKGIEHSEEMRLVEAIRGLAKRCEDGVHLYLRFIGD